MITQSYLTDSILALTGKTLISFEVAKTVIDRNMSYFLITTKLEEEKDTVDFVLMSSSESGAILYVAGPEHYEMFNEAKTVSD